MTETGSGQAQASARTSPQAEGVTPPRFTARFHRDYAKWKLRLDPVYKAVGAVLEQTQEPLLDIGCGIGLLAHYLRWRGINIPFFGADFDVSKIAAARQTSASLKDVSFTVMDFREAWPAHSGSVTLLDVLQYAPPSERQSIFEQAALRTSAAGRLIIRTGIRDDSWRFHFTWTIDRLANLTSWMKSRPHKFPTAEEITNTAAEQQLKLISAEPLQGKLPFNNFLFVFSRQ